MPEPAPRSDLITATEAAELLGRTSRTVVRWAGDGKLPPATKLPGLRAPFLFNRSDVEALAAKLRDNAESAA